MIQWNLNLQYCVEGLQFLLRAAGEKQVTDLRCLLILLKSHKKQLLTRTFRLKIKSSLILVGHGLSNNAPEARIPETSHPNSSKDLSVALSMSLTPLCHLSSVIYGQRFLLPSTRDVEMALEYSPPCFSHYLRILLPGGKDGQERGNTLSKHSIKSFEPSRPGFEFWSYHLPAVWNETSFNISDPGVKHIR